MSLTNHSIGILVSRTLGIYVFILALSYIPAIGSLPTGVVLTGLLLDLSLSSILLFRASWVSTFLIKGTTDTEHASPLTIDQVTTAAFVIIGLMAVVRAVPELIGTLLTRPLADLTAGRFFASLIQWSIQIGLGVWLMFGAKGISTMIQRLRS